MSKKYFIPSDSFTEAHNSFPVPDIGWLQTLANSVAEITKRNDDAVTEIKTSQWLFDLLKDFPKSKTTSIWGGIRVIEKDWVPENLAFLYNAKGDAIEMWLYKNSKLYRTEIPKYYTRIHPEGESICGEMKMFELPKAIHHMPQYPNGDTFDD